MILNYARIARGTVLATRTPVRLDCVPRTRLLATLQPTRSVTADLSHFPPTFTSQKQLPGVDRRISPSDDLSGTTVFPPAVSRARHTLSIQSGRLSIEQDGEWKAIPARALRDMCTCRQCRHPDTAQRNINILGDRSLSVVSIQKFDKRGPGFEISFSDGHVVSLASESIEDRLSLASERDRYGMTGMTAWDSSINENPPIVSYRAMTDGIGMRDLMCKIRQFGFAFVDGLPPTPEASQALLESIGPIRNTHYGGFYDFTSDLSSKDTAYTSEALESHTDNTYFTEPAGLQALHMLSHTDGTGGESSLVDGFNAAAQLLSTNPEAYALLSTTGVYAHASGNDGISVQPARPYPSLGHHPILGDLIQVRWNNADRAGVNLDVAKLEEWYDAAAEFDALLNNHENVYWFQLRPGRMLIFDNWRVLHGRAAFTGKRRMCGGYINRDDFISRYRMTNLSAERIRASTVT